uniref:Uncharacterized protein n=1 Tax=Caenorhabditis japonica TaxID=281687 RepID=A0A8R1EFX5_CAEJA
MANGLMRPVLIRTQQLIPLQRNPGMVVALLPQLMPLQLARGIRPGYQRQRVMRLTAALSQGWIDGSPNFGLDELAVHLPGALFTGPIPFTDR